jgi:hypothetical protein
MPHLISIYKNDFVKDIARILPLTLSLAVCQTPLLFNKRSASQIRGKRSDALHVAKPAWLKAKADS